MCRANRKVHLPIPAPANTRRLSKTTASQTSKVRIIDGAAVARVKRAVDPQVISFPVGESKGHRLLVWVSPVLDAQMALQYTFIIEQGFIVWMAG